MSKNFFIRPVDERDTMTLPVLKSDTRPEENAAVAVEDAPAPPAPSGVVDYSLPMAGPIVEYVSPEGELLAAVVFGAHDELRDLQVIHPDGTRSVAFGVRESSEHLPGTYHAS